MDLYGSGAMMGSEQFFCSCCLISFSRSTFFFLMTLKSSLMSSDLLCSL